MSRPTYSAIQVFSDSIDVCFDKAAAGASQKGKRTTKNDVNRSLVNKLCVCRGRDTYFFFLFPSKPKGVHITKSRSSDNIDMCRTRGFFTPRQPRGSPINIYIDGGGEREERMKKKRTLLYYRGVAGAAEETTPLRLSLLAHRLRCYIYRRVYDTQLLCMY